MSISAFGIEHDELLAKAAQMTPQGKRRLQHRAGGAGVVAGGAIGGGLTGMVAGPKLARGKIPRAASLVGSAVGSYGGGRLAERPALRLVRRGDQPVIAPATE